jgi:SPP1 gp7 family putative phage head morphogenesis protein
MASPSAILRAAKAVPGAAAATPPPQGVPGWMGAMSPLARELAAPDSYRNTYGPFLPRPPQDFTQGAFGPFSPILPVPVDAPEDNGRAEPRREQYETGWNLPTGVPGTEGIGKLASFATLRSIADLYSVARACIQLRKNEIRGIEWDIVPTTDAAKAMRNSPKQMKDFGERRGQAVAFFRRPDPDYFSWASFIDDALEQMFVFDAMSLYLAPKRGKGLRKGLLGSDLDSLQLVDGQTIRPLYDVHGATPRPPSVAYQQYLYGVPRSDFSAVFSGRDIEESGLSGAEARAWRGDQLLYLPFVRRRWSPYGFTAVERALIPIMSGLQKQGWQLDYFRQGTVPACYISPGDVTMTPNQIRELQDSLNAITGDPAWHHKIIVLPPGSKTMPQRDVALADAFDEIVRVDTCMGFDVEPMELGIAPKVSTTMSPGAANQMAKMAQSKVDRKSTGPILRYLASVCDYILRDVCHQDDMRFLFDGLEEEDDEATETTLIVSQVGSALRSVDEGREKLGLQPWGLPETSDPIIVTPTGPVSLQAAMALNAAPPQAAPPAGGAPERPAPTRPGQPAAADAPARPVPAGQKPPAGPQQAGQKPESSQGESPGHVAAEAAHDSQSANQGANPTGKAAARELDALVAHLRWGGEVSAFKAANLPPVTLAMISEDLSKGLSVDEAVGGARTLLLGKADYEWVAKGEAGPPGWPGWDLDEILAGIYSSRLATAFKAAAKAITQAVGRFLGSGAGAAQAAVTAIRQAVEDSLGGILQDALTEGYALGQQAAMAMITETDAVDWGDWVPGDVEAAAKVADAQGLSDLLSDYGISAIRSISGTNMGQVADLLSDALSGGLSSSTLAQQIVGLLLSPSRAQMIAQTEIARAVSSATIDRFNAMGVTAKEWLVAPARACPICLKNAAQGPIPTAAEFQSGQVSPPAHPRCRCSLTPAAINGVDITGKSVRVIDLNGQEARRDRRQDDVGGYAAGGGAAGVRPHLADGTQIDIPGGVPGSQAGGEPPRWDGSEPEPRVTTAPDDEDDADYPGERGVPPRPGTYWPAPYMDGYWPQGGHGSTQAGTSSPGGHGPRGRPPNGVGKGAADLSDPNPVEAQHVYSQMLADFPPKAIAWVKEPAIHWVGPVAIPQDRIDYEDADSWAASHQPLRVKHFARKIKAGEDVAPGICVQKPGEGKVTVIDGHHRALAFKKRDKPFVTYVGFVPADSGPWDETHSSQYSDSEKAAEKSAAPAVPIVAGLAVLAADTGRVLMLQRALDPDDPAGGCWEFPGGHLESGESPVMAALREWSEETGCTAPRGMLTGSWDSPNGVYRGFVLTVGSEADVDIFDGRDQAWNPDDPHGDRTEAIAWWDPALLRGNPALRPELAADLDRVLAAIGGGDIASKAAVPGLTSRSGMISLDLPPGTVRPVPGGVDDHHVTVVYLGPDLDDEAFANACARAADAASRVPGPLVGILAGVDSFPPSPSSDGKVPAFIPARIPGAERLREALANLSASEHVNWSPHVTLAYIDEGDPLPDPGPPVPATFTHLSVHRGDDVQQFPLGG